MRNLEDLEKAKRKIRLEIPNLTDDEVSSYAIGYIDGYEARIKEETKTTKTAVALPNLPECL